MQQTCDNTDSLSPHRLNHQAQCRIKTVLHTVRLLSESEQHKLWLRAHRGVTGVLILLTSFIVTVMHQHTKTDSWSVFNATFDIRNMKKDTM